MNCHHCSAPVLDSPYHVVLSGMDEDYELPICRSCQAMRQSGQLPVDLLVQQWAFARSGEQAASSGELDLVTIQLDCLGCGGGFRPASSDSPASVLAHQSVSLEKGEHDLRFALRNFCYVGDVAE